MQLCSVIQGRADRGRELLLPLALVTLRRVTNSLPLAPNLCSQCKAWTLLAANRLEVLCARWVLACRLTANAAIDPCLCLLFSPLLPSLLRQPCSVKN